MVSFNIIFDSDTIRRLPLDPKLSNKGSNKVFLDPNGRTLYTIDTSLGSNEFLIFGYKFSFEGHHHAFDDKNQSAYSVVFNKHSEAPQQRKAVQKVKGGKCRKHALPMSHVTMQARRGLMLKSTFPYIGTEFVVTNFTVRVPVTFSKESLAHLKTKEVKIEIPDATPGKCCVTIGPNAGTVVVVTE